MTASDEAIAAADRSGIVKRSPQWWGFCAGYDQAASRYSKDAASAAATLSRHASSVAKLEIELAALIDGIKKATNP